MQDWTNVGLDTGGGERKGKSFFVFVGNPQAFTRLVFFQGWWAAPAPGVELPFGVAF